MENLYQKYFSAAPNLPSISYNQNSYSKLHFSNLNIFKTQNSNSSEKLKTIENRIKEIENVNMKEKEKFLNFLPNHNVYNSVSTQHIATERSQNRHLVPNLNTNRFMSPQVNSNIKSNLINNQSSNIANYSNLHNKFSERNNRIQNEFNFYSPDDISSNLAKIKKEISRSKKRVKSENYSESEDSEDYIDNKSYNRQIKMINELKSLNSKLNNRVLYLEEQNNNVSNAFQYIIESELKGNSKQFASAILSGDKERIDHLKTTARVKLPRNLEPFSKLANSSLKKRILTKSSRYVKLNNDSNSKIWNNLKLSKKSFQAVRNKNLEHTKQK